jgi:hypothetical protein
MPLAALSPYTPLCDADALPRAARIAKDKRPRIANHGNATDNKKVK